MDPEIACLIFKFQNLCHDGKEANLTLSSKNGKAIVNLNVQLGNELKHKELQLQMQMQLKKLMF